MKSVFISHSSKDIATANLVVDCLEKEGISVWIAPRDIPAGSNYGASITKGIRECAVLVLLFSKESNESHAVFREVQMAFDEKKVIIPLRLEDVPVSDDLGFYLSGLHWLDALPKQKNVHELVQDVKQVLQNIGTEIHEALPKTQVSVQKPPRKMLGKVKIVAIASTSAAGILFTILLIVGLLFPATTPEPTPEQEIAQAAQPTPAPTLEPTPYATPEPEPTLALEPEVFTWQQALEIALTHSEARSEYIIWLDIFLDQDHEHGPLSKVYFYEFTPFGRVDRWVLIDPETMEIVEYDEGLWRWGSSTEPPREGQIGWEQALESTLEHVDTARIDIYSLWIGTWRDSRELVYPEWDAWAIEVRGMFFGQNVLLEYVIIADTGVIYRIVR